MVELGDHVLRTSAQPAPQFAPAESGAHKMTEFDGPFDGTQLRHTSTWTGMCSACDLIWPCPPVRAKLNALFATESQLRDEMDHGRTHHLKLVG